MKNGFLAVAALALFAGSASAQLISGSIAFTGFNADGNDDLGWVALSDIPAGTQIFFSDNEFVSGAFNTGESFSVYTAPIGGVAAGTVVSFTNFTAGTTASVGTLAPVTVSGSANRGIAASGEAIYAYLGGSATAPTTFLAAITNDVFGNAAAPLLGTGLAGGTTALQLNSSDDGARYVGIRSGLNSFADYLPLLNNLGANWETTGTDGTVYVPFDGTAFTIVPAPGAIALFGMGSLMIARRRRA